MKILGLDVGTKRIGVAKADTGVRIATPVCTVSVDGTEFEQIARLAKENHTNLFVLGLPRNVLGQETAQAAYTKVFAQSLEKAIPGAKIRFQDESFTSVEAKSRLKAQKTHSNKARQNLAKSGQIDAEAAVIILTDFIESFSVKSFNSSAKNFSSPVEEPNLSAKSLSSDDKSSAMSQTSVTPATKPNAKKNSKSTMPKKSSSKTRHRWYHRPINRVKRLILLIFIAIFALLTTAGVGVFGWYQISLGPVSRNQDCSSASSGPCAFQNFSITANESAQNIADRLAAAKLIHSSLALQIYLRVNNLSAQLKTGVFKLRTTMTVAEIVETITKNGAAENVFRLTILPGETLVDFKAKLLKLGYNSLVIDTALAAKYDHPILKDKPADASLEGYIFGDTYEFFQGETVQNIIKRTLDQLQAKVNQNNIIPALKEQGFTLWDGIRLASVVQKEARPADQAMVAGVFLNRLHAGQTLGSDVTAKYAVDLIDPNRTIYNNNAAVLAYDSCYNTRKHTGLPCGAISNPGLSALLAVAHPTPSKYLFFLTGDDGKMYYSTTYSGHEYNIRKFCKEYCQAAL